MHNLRTIVGFEFFRTIKKRSFWIRILALPALFTMIFGISYFSSTKTHEEIEATERQGLKISVLDESGLISQTQLMAMGATAEKDREAGVQGVKQGRLDAFIYYPNDPSRDQIEVFGKDIGLMENDRYSSIAENLLKSSILERMSSEQKAILEKSPKVKLIAYKDNQETPGFKSVIAPGVLLAVFYFIIILFGPQMLTTITEEKENRVIEMILTTTKTRTLVIGKILAIVLLGFLQILVMTAPFIIAFALFRDALHLPAISLSELSIDSHRMLIGAGLFLLSFLLFTGILVTIGATMPTARDASSFFGIIMIFIFAPFYAFSAIIADPHQLIVKVFSFFPLTAPMTLMLRNAVGNLTPFEVTLGMGILLVSASISFYIAIRVFHQGALEYGRKLHLREILGIPSRNC